MQFVNNVWAVLIDTAFWLLLGLLAAGFIKAYIPENAMKRWVGGRGFGAVSRAALFGAPLPLCSCGVLPAAIGLKRAGASNEATVSFLISTPETSVDSVAVTYALMGPVMAVYRPVAALMSAVVTGMMTATIDEEVSPAPAEITGCCSSTSEESEESSCCAAEMSVKPETKWWSALKFASAELLDDIALWMAIGIIVAGAMLSFIPPGMMAEWGRGASGMLLMLVIGIPMYICAVASTPIAAGLLLAGVSPGAVLVFLLVGPATNIASFALIRRELGNKVTAVYFAGIASVSLIMGLLLEWLLANYDLSIQANLGHAHDMLPMWLSVGSAVMLLILAVKPVRRRLLPSLG